MAAAVQRIAIEAERHRFTFRQTRRTVPITFSMMLVQASERRSSFGSLSRVTVRISSTFQDRARDPGPVSFETLGKVAEQLFSLVGIVQLPGLSQHTSNRSVQRFGQSLHNVAGLVDLTALDCRGSSEGSADCFGQGLGAVDDEEPRHRRVEPALDEIVDERLNSRGIFLAPSARPSGCLSPFASTPSAATRIRSSSM